MKKLFAFALALLCLFTSVSLGSSAGILEASDNSKSPISWPTTADGTPLSESLCKYVDRPTDQALIDADKEMLDNLIELGRYDPEIDAQWGGPSYNYNCHSAAWYSIYENHYWIDYPYDYLKDNHCTLSSQTYPGTGHIAVYYKTENSIRRPVHSALVFTVNSGRVRCVSKWGACGLYLHDLDHVPLEYLQNGVPDVVYYAYPTHNYGTWQDYSQTAHIKKCTIGKCAESITESHTYGSWQQTNNTVHTKYCKVCKHAVTENHSLSYANTSSSTSHSAKCSTCGITFSQSHTFGSWVNANATNHTRTCSKCKYSQSASHSFTVYSQTGSTSTHNVKCSSCSRTISESHSITRWVNSGPSGHKGTCNKCGQSVTRAHTFSGTACTVCGYTGPGVIDGQNPVDE